MNTHSLARVDHEPHPGFSPTTTYIAQCGYSSQNKNEFINPTTSRQRYTCEDCRARICRKCGAPGYATENGYRYQLCETHLRENFAVIGIEIPV